MYRSGAIVRCRKGDIWKDLKEEDYFTGSKFIDDEGNEFSVEQIYNFVKKNETKYYISNFPLDKIKHNIEWWNKNYDIKNPTHKERMMNADTSFPLLVIIEKNCNFSVADGLNRLYKAIKIENKQTLPIYLINKSEIEQISNKLMSEESPHKWFSRRGGKGSSSGWVDCNTCRDGKCKQCGRQKGEKRAKYPSCRPTPAACKDPGKGKTWGKTK
jgi:hypothetical protein